MSRGTSVLPVISGIATDIPVSVFFKRVIPGYQHVCMLKNACSGLLNAHIARTVIWIGPQVTYPGYPGLSQFIW